MAKKHSQARKASGIQSVETIDDDLDHATTNGHHDEHSEPEASVIATKSGKNSKSKEDQSAAGNFGVGDVKKAAAFANSIGGLDKAIALLQILKVAKEVM